MITNEIILRAQKKDIKAIETIYIEYKDFVWNVALKTTKNISYAEDVAAEVFIKIFRKISKFKFRSSFKTWLYRITVNTSLNHMKKENRKLTLQLNENCHAIDPNSKNFDGEQELLTVSLESLEPTQKIMLILREVEGFSYQEISEILQMNLGTVKTNIYRARDSLRAAYKKTGGMKDVV